VVCCIENITRVLGVVALVGGLLYGRRPLRDMTSMIDTRRADCELQTTTEDVLAVRSNKAKTRLKLTGDMDFIAFTFGHNVARVAPRVAAWR
jgi:hypothetical protein